ncbi:hypothetical protein D9M09_14810 [Janthinobacterium agaricidamnosum]|uniref:Uncharacterized protein n=1 Tax=Janthinobacterium agaricidamnosum TaxID=55508 RepID=A0A3G2E9A7_9BURK|nr:hypothetical protein [Janthinobacterium agaricidamnosum]AYM76928.1 hypothetical protein D9M09_14810 [Janthinobacterium agaricidamnosum]
MREKRSIDTKDGWEIFSTCEEDNPLDWRPGNPIRFKAFGFAEYTEKSGVKDEFSCTSRQNFPEAGVHHVFTYEDGHEDVRKELRKAIKRLKSM